MRKFKLIKSYPGLPINTYYAILCSDFLGRWKITNKEENITLKFENDVDKFPEFWEEVKEETYKILSLSLHGNIYSISNETNGNEVKYKFKEGFLVLSTFQKINGVIHSIQRLSDSEVFTIGDDTILGKITKIEIGNACVSGIKLSFKDGVKDNVADLCFRKFNDSSQEFLVQKIKPPKFITEDGVSMFVGDKYCYICNNEVMNSVVKDSKYCPMKNYYFSTREKAEEYLINNRPLFSLNDILNMGKNLSIPDTCMIYKKELREFAKQKLNL